MRPLAEFVYRGALWKDKPWKTFWLLVVVCVSLGIVYHAAKKLHTGPERYSPLLARMQSFTGSDDHSVGERMTAMQATRVACDTIHRLVGDWRLFNNSGDKSQLIGGKGGDLKEYRENGFIVPFDGKFSENDLIGPPIIQNLKVKIDKVRRDAKEVLSADEVCGFTHRTRETNDDGLFDTDLIAQLERKVAAAQDLVWAYAAYRLIRRSVADGSDGTLIRPLPLWAALALDGHREEAITADFRKLPPAEPTLLDSKVNVLCQEPPYPSPDSKFEIGLCFPLFRDGSDIFKEAYKEKVDNARIREPLTCDDIEAAQYTTQDALKLPLSWLMGTHGIGYRGVLPISAACLADKEAEAPEKSQNAGNSAKSFRDFLNKDYAARGCWDLHPPNVNPNLDTGILKWAEGQRWDPDLAGCVRS